DLGAVVALRVTAHPLEAEAGRAVLPAAVAGGLRLADVGLARDRRRRAVHGRRRLRERRRSEGRSRDREDCSNDRETSHGNLLVVGKRLRSAPRYESQGRNEVRVVFGTATKL